MAIKLPSFKNSNLRIDQQTQITISIIACLCCALVSFLSVLGIAGVLGNSLGAFLRSLLGRASFTIPLFFIYGAYELVRAQLSSEDTTGVRSRIFWGLGVITFGVAGILAWSFKVEEIADIGKEGPGGSGGYIGFSIYFLFNKLVGRISSLIVMLGVLSIGAFIISGATFVEFLEELGKVFKNPLSIWDKVPDFFAFLNKEEMATVTSSNPSKVEIPTQNIPNTVVSQAFQEPVTKYPDPLGSRIIDVDPINTEGSSKVFNFTNKVSEDGKTLEMEASEVKVAKHVPKVGKSGWTLPNFELLSDQKTLVVAGDIELNKQTIKSTLGHFNINVEMKDVTVGPTVSQYTLEPNSGVRLSSIDALSRDLALSLAAVNIRIQAPIPGKKLVGVEIPNQQKETVRLRDIIQTKEFLEFDQDLPIAVGKDVTGTNIIYPLAKMPHLLVAGATGAGKSVWINGLLLSLLYRYAPSQLGIILVDMKRVELKLYDGVPHLLSPVITDAEKAINSLKWTVLEMERRYKILEETGKRNIRDYNKYADTVSKQRMSYIVFVVDELGDLMMLAKNEVEPIIVRLTQMSRAVGIHIVLGTQRPDTQVVTGLIKANIPTRIAFAVASQIDSRVILDQVGAEKLLGQGDGMIVTPSDLGARRFQGALVEESEVRKCVNFLRDQALSKQIDLNYLDEVTQKPQVRINIPGMPKGEFDDQDEDKKDNSYEEAKRLVTQYQKASTSFLQNRMGIGYPKASKIITQLEDEGLVGPANGSKPRDIYIRPNEEE
jgi:DNA segregation ATPase FtsK/SpoIIIE, S-DNA-T family